MSNLTIDLQNISDEDKKILMEIIKRSNASKSKVWKPVAGDPIYVLWSSGRVTKEWYGEVFEFDYEYGNAFATQEAAEFESERRKFLKRWRDLSIESGEMENEWNGKNPHWYCHCSFDNKIIVFESLYCYKGESTYFPTIESIKNAIEEIGEGNVKKYILGVKE